MLFLQSGNKPCVLKRRPSGFDIGKMLPSWCRWQPHALLHGHQEERLWLFHISLSQLLSFIEVPIKFFVPPSHLLLSICWYRVLIWCNVFRAVQRVSQGLNVRKGHLSLQSISNITITTVIILIGLYYYTAIYVYRCIHTVWRHW